MLASLTHNLSRLASFAGRESRALFWPYAVCVFVPAFVVTAAIMVPEINASLDRMLRYAAEHPEEAAVSQEPGGVSVTIQGFHPELMPDLERIAVPLALTFAVAIVLLAAAVARRLHDRGRRGFWGLLPLPFLALGYYLFAYVLTDPSGGSEFSPMLVVALFLNNLIYLATLLFLIVQLASPGTPGENRFG
jgi:uncharacterized membrane protein YhaH (DUF805 family)